MSHDQVFTIRNMIELTGLSEFTIRGWENRYSAFSPSRSETGRREYSKDDVERALLLRELLKRGFKISKIAQMSNSELKSKFELNFESSSKSEPTKRANEIEKALKLLALQNWKELQKLFEKIPQNNSKLLIYDFLLPLVSELASQIRQGLVSVSQEHILSTMVKEKIYFALNHTLKSQKRLNRKGLRIVLATPEGDHHEIGLLLAHLLLKSMGHSSLYLGTHTPVQELSETSLRFGATHVLLVSTVSKLSGAHQEPLEYIRDLKLKVGPDIKLLIAGPQSFKLSANQDSNLINFARFNDLEKYLDDFGGRKWKTTG